MLTGNFAELNSAYHVQYNVGLMLIALMTIGLVTYGAFSIALRVSRAKLRSAWIWRSWWIAGSLVLGLCLWSAQFVYMLACTLPVSVHYDLQLTLLSMIPAILAASLLLKVESRARQGPAIQWMIATAVGASVVLTHYMGMAAMHMDVLIIFDSVRLTAAVLMTILVAYASIWLRSKLELASVQKQGLIPGLLSMMAAMAALIVTVNHSFILATRFMPNPGGLDLAGEMLISSQVLISIALATVAGILVLLFAAIQFGYRMDLSAGIRDEKAYTQAVLETSMEAIISVDSIGVIRGFNKAAEQMFQYRASTVIGRNFMLLLPRPARKMLERELASCRDDASDPVHEIHEIKALRADGREFPAEIRIGPVEDHGRIGFVGVVRDTSEQKHTESARLRAEKRLEILLEASPVVIYTCAVTGTMPIEYVSPNIHEIFGFDPDALTTAPVYWSNRIHPEDRDALINDRKSLHRNGHDYREYRIMLNSGQYRWVSDSQSMIYDDEGHPFLLVGAWADIHERKLSDLNLALTRERLRISVDMHQMGTWDWIMQSGKFHWSESTNRKLGLVDEAADGFDHFISTVHSEDRTKIRNAFRQSLVSGDALDEEYRVIWPDKSIHWMHSIGHLVNDERGHPLHMVGITHDVTDQKQLHLAPRRSARIG